MLPIEFTWQPFLTRNRLPGHYVFGYAHDTSRYPDVLGRHLPTRLLPPAACTARRWICSGLRATR
ncbi:carbohydrate porin [Acetobacter persici]|uniref:carbohydrate porin n=1 Tax=Acetobacter persici TaxID=1076596 RepID=UPI0031345819